jgi:hypothetical protein
MLIDFTPSLFFLLHGGDLPDWVFLLMLFMLFGVPLATLGVVYLIVFNIMKRDGRLKGSSNKNTGDGE